MTQLDAMLAALADPHRRGVVDLLRHEPRRAGDLADELGMSRPAMSRHLKVLRRTGLIEPASDEADARARVYRLLPEPFSALRRWLDDVERFWSHELDAFRAHAEATRGARGASDGASSLAGRARSAGAAGRASAEGGASTPAGASGRAVAESRAARGRGAIATRRGGRAGTARR